MTSREASLNKKRQESSAFIYYSLSNSKPTKTQQKNYSAKNKNYIKDLQSKVRISNTPPPPSPVKVNTNYKHITAKVECSGQTTRAATPNFIERNKSVSSSQTTSVISTPIITTSRPQTSLGKVPKYLINRKLEWAKAEQDKKIALQQSLIPKGMKLMDEETRQKTLASLEDSKKPLLLQLSKLPFASTTLKTQNKKNELEKKLIEIEDAIGMFSRPLVYISKDEDGNDSEKNEEIASCG